MDANTAAAKVRAFVEGVLDGLPANQVGLFLRMLSDDVEDWRGELDPGDDLDDDDDDDDDDDEGG